MSSVAGLDSTKPSNLQLQTATINKDQYDVTVESVQQDSTIQFKMIENSVTKGTIGPKRANLNRTNGQLNNIDLWSTQHESIQVTARRSNLKGVLPITGPLVSTERMH